MKDSEHLKLLEKHVASSGVRSLVYDDQLIYEILKNTTLTTCPLCDGELEHSISSVCAGHGEFPRYLEIKCCSCSISHKGCVDYGESWQGVERSFLVRCSKIARAVADQLRKGKTPPEQEDKQ